MIGELVEQKTGYKLVYSMQIIIEWINVQIDKLRKKEIRLGIEVEHDDYKIIVEQFAK